MGSEGGGQTGPALFVPLHWVRKLLLSNVSNVTKERISEEEIKRTNAHATDQQIHHDVHPSPLIKPLMCDRWRGGVREVSNRSESSSRWTGVGEGCTDWFTIITIGRLGRRQRRGPTSCERTHVLLLLHYVNIDGEARTVSLLLRSMWLAASLCDSKQHDVASSRGEANNYSSRADRDADITTRHIRTHHSTLLSRAQLSLSQNFVLFSVLNNSQAIIAHSGWRKTFHLQIYKRNIEDSLFFRICVTSHFWKDLPHLDWKCKFLFSFYWSSRRMLTLVVLQ